MEAESRQAKTAEERKRKRLPAGATTSIHDLSDDLLEIVLLGLDSPKWLVRATATCKPWRRLIAGTGGAFLRCFRSLHAPPAVGTFYSIIYDHNPCSYGRNHFWPEVDPVFVPSSASASDGLQLSLDFVLPADEGPRELTDDRGSLLLLVMELERGDHRDCHCCYHHADHMIPDLVVCEPLTRRYQAIPPPDDRVSILGAFLLDGHADDGIGLANFRVLLVLYQHDLYGDRLYTDYHNGHGYLSASFTTGNRNTPECSHIFLTGTPRTHREILPPAGLEVFVHSDFIRFKSAATSPSVSLCARAYLFPNLANSLL
ncbi:unnamed protein product [Urochloa humidicola]